MLTSHGHARELWPQGRLRIRGDPRCECRTSAPGRLPSPGTREKRSPTSWACFPMESCRTMRLWTTPQDQQTTPTNRMPHPPETSETSHCGHTRPPAHPTRQLPEASVGLSHPHPLSACPPAPPLQASGGSGTAQGPSCSRQGPAPVRLGLGTCPWWV